MSLRRLGAILLIAAVQGCALLGTFAIAFGLADGRRRVPWPLAATVAVLAFPGLYLAPYLQSSLGDPAAIYVAAGLGGVTWGATIVGVAGVVRRHRARRTD